MADISKIKLPDGQVYNIKDTLAREMMAHSLELVNCEDGLPGPAGSQYSGRIYLVPHQHGTQDIYDEYVVVQSTTSPDVWSWERIGNTDIDMSNYSLRTHKHTVTTNIAVSPHSYTPAGSVGLATFVGQPATINLSGSVDGDIRVIVNTQPTQSQINYTPSGTIAGTLDSSPNHTHTIGGTTRYLHKTSVPTSFNTTAAVNSASTSKLVKRQVKVVTGTATVSRLTGSSTKQVAKAGTSVSIPKYNLDSQTTTVHNLTNAVTTGNRATGALSSNAVAQGANTPMWNAKIDPNDTETLMFEFKELSVATTVVDIDPTPVNFKNLTSAGNENLIPAVANGSVHEYSKTDVTVATTDNNNIWVATGETDGQGTGATVVTGVTTTDVLSGVSTSEDVYSSINDTALDGDPIITAIDASTGSAGNHTHTFTPIFTGDPVCISAELNTNTVTAQGSYTPEGSVNAPTFTGTPATLEHEVTGNGPYTTSQADS